MYLDCLAYVHTIQLLLSCLLSVDLQYTVWETSVKLVGTSICPAVKYIVINLKSIPAVSQGAVSEGCAVIWFTYTRAHSRKILASLVIWHMYIVRCLYCVLCIFCKYFARHYFSFLFKQCLAWKSDNACCLIKGLKS